MAQAKEEIIIEINVRYEEALKNIGKYKSEINRIKLDQEQFSGELKRGEITEKEYSRSVIETNAAIKERQSRIRLLEKEVQNNIKAENALAGSYNQISAQIAILKNRQKELSAEQNPEEYQRLAQEINNLNNILKKADSEMGDFQRNVGNYAIAQKSIRSELRLYTEELARMIQQGKQGTPEYEELRIKVGQLKDAFSDASQSIKNTASDTSSLDALNQGVQTLIGSFGLYNSVIGLADTENEELDETMKNLQITMAALSSAIAIKNALQKQSSLIQGILKVQEKSRIAATALSTKGTIAATVAQKAFNIVAMANPYVLLAVALLSVVGALAIFAYNTDKSAKNQKKLNEQEKIWLDYLKEEIDQTNAVSNERIAHLERELNIAKSRNASLDETRKIEDKILSERIKSHRTNVQSAGEELRDLEKNRKKLKELSDMLLDLQQKQKGILKKVKIDVDFDGDMDKVKIDEAIEAIQGKIDNTKKSIDIAVNLKAEGEDLAAQQKIQNNERSKDDETETKRQIDVSKEQKAKELEAIRAAQDAANELIKDNQERELTILRTGSERQVSELQNRLKTEANLSAAAKEAINNQILSIQEKFMIDEKAINDKYSDEELAKLLANEQEKIELRLLKAKEGSDEEFAALRSQLELQRDYELANEKLTESQKKLIRAKYQKQIDDNVEAQAAALRSRQAQALTNELNSQLQALGDNELAKERLKLDFAKKEQDGLVAMDAATKEQLYGSDEAYTAAVTESKGKIIDAEKAVRKAALANAEAVFSSIGTIGGAVEGLFNDLAGDNEAMAEFTKAIALFNIGVSTAEAIAVGLPSAMEMPFPTNLVAVGTVIATVFSNIAKAKQTLNKEKEPKAPKFASGGVVQGVSFSGDNVTARVNSGEMILNAAQQARLFDMANNNIIQRSQPSYELLTNAFMSAMSQMPAPVLDYKEFTDFQKRVITYNENARI